MKDLFFIYDNDNCMAAGDRLYGYLLKDGQLGAGIQDFDENEYYNYLGAFTAFKRSGDSVSVCQDANGSFGLFYYYKDGYYAISNSFALLHQFLKSRGRKLSLDTECAAYLLMESGYPHVVSGTPCKEINLLRPHEKLIIGRDKFEIKKGWELPPAPLDEPEGLEIIDRWISKYLNCILSYADYPMRCDVSGGKDSRICLGLTLLARNKLKNLTFFSRKNYAIKDDYQIAQELAKKFNFTLNSANNPQYKLPGNEGAWISSLLLNLGGHAYPYFTYAVYNEPFIHIMGQGGENIRKYGFKEPEDYSRNLMSKDQSDRFLGFQAVRFFWRQLITISQDPANQGAPHAALVHKIMVEAGNRSHFGRFNILRWLSNELTIPPLLDKALHSIQSQYKGEYDPDLLAAVISLRLHPNLLDISFNNKARYSEATISAAKKINAIKPLALNIGPMKKSVINNAAPVLRADLPRKIDDCYEELFKEFSHPPLHDFIKESVGEKYLAEALDYFKDKSRHHPEQKIFKLLTFKPFLENSSIIPQEFADSVYNG